MLEVLNQSCLPCRRGLDPRHYFRAVPRTYSFALRRDCLVYVDQNEIMQQFLARPFEASGWTLDYEQSLFHPVFKFDQKKDVSVTPSGRLQGVTGSVAALLHYKLFQLKEVLAWRPRA